MKINHSIALVLVLTLVPGITFAMNGNRNAAGQQPQGPVVESSHVLSPNSIDPSVQTTTTTQSPLPARDLYQKYSRLVSQARDQAHSVVDSATDSTFNADLTTRQYKELQQSLGNLKQEHERFYKGLTQEQQNAIQTRNANLLQAQERLQNLVKEMEREFSDPTLHMKDVADQSRATQREVKSYQKQFLAMGKDLGYTKD